MSNSPIKVIRAGYIKGTIWENKNKKGEIYHSIDISRSYRDGEGKWHETNQLFTEQLPQARVVADNSYAFIHERLNNLRAEQKSEESDKSAPAKKRGQRKSHAAKVEEERAATGKTK